MEQQHPAISVLDAIHCRHSVRSYLPTPVDETCIKQLLAAAVQAPTGLDLEPWAFVVVQDKLLLRKLSDHAKESFLREVNRYYFDRSGCTQTFEHVEENADFNFFYNASTLILICAKSTTPFAFADCWLAAQNLMLAAHAMGLGSCVVGSALTGLNTGYAREEIGMPDSYMVVAPIIVGLPTADGVPAPRKKPKVLAWRSGE